MCGCLVSVHCSHGGFCFPAQALDSILEKMKISGFNFSGVLALSGAGQVCLQRAAGTERGQLSWAVEPVPGGWRPEREGAQS